MNEPIRLALIGKRKVQYDLCAEEKNVVGRIPNLASRLDYLGEGRIISIDGAPYTGKEERLHFWKFKTQS